MAEFLQAILKYRLIVEIAGGGNFELKKVELDRGFLELGGLVGLENNETMKLKIKPEKMFLKYTEKEEVFIAIKNELRLDEDFYSEDKKTIITGSPVLIYHRGSGLEEKAQEILEQLKN